MSESSLVSYRNYTKHYNKRTQKISKITIHHMANVWTAKQCVDFFATTPKSASSNYCIGYSGDIGQSVSESNMAWTSNSTWNDQRAVTIEVSNSSMGGNWPISDASYKSLIALCVDICKRNGIKSVNYTGNQNGILTCHFFYANTACPGPYLRQLHENGQIVKDINNALSGSRFVVDGIDCNYVFDPVYYYKKYPDLQAAIGPDPDKLFGHFLQFGMKEARQAKADFNVIVYKNNNPDLQAVFGNYYPKYYQHYCITGHNENRVHC